jgi:predicted protein tyrosine phosphatase
MIEVYPHLWVGDEEDYSSNIKYSPGWYVLQACKEPFHREALGYTGRGAPKDHPEYLFARRGTRLILNMVDADDPKYFPHEMIEAALDFLDEVLLYYIQEPVLVHCNKGESRAPSLAFLWVHSHLKGLVSLEKAEEEFRRIYPAYAPKAGIRGYLQANWDRYRRIGT